MYGGNNCCQSKWKVQEIMVSRKGMVSHFIGLVVIILECFPKCPVTSQIPFSPLHLYTTKTLCQILCNHLRACCLDLVLHRKWNLEILLLLQHCWVTAVQHQCHTYVIPLFQHSLTAFHKTMGNLKKTDMIAKSPSHFSTSKSLCFGEACRKKINGKKMVQAVDRKRTPSEGKQCTTVLRAIAPWGIVQVSLFEWQKWC